MKDLEQDVLMVVDQVSELRELLEGIIEQQKLITDILDMLLGEPK